MELTLTQLYQKMRHQMGASGWWPADSKEEIIIGAILIQNTNWRNADKARLLIKSATNFQPALILALSTSKLQELVRPAGFFKNKTKAIQSVFTWLNQYHFDYYQICKYFGPQLRQELLKLHGVGQETADVLLTYIFDVPTFICDKYARTLFTLLGVSGLTDYQSLARQIDLNSEITTPIAQDFHGLIDEFGKIYFHPLEKFQTSFLASDHLRL